MDESFLSGMMRGIMGDRSKPQKVFDWDKAATLIRDRKPNTAQAGLDPDWPSTGGLIFANGKIVPDTYTYLSSFWATPCIILDDGPREECWRFAEDTPGWDANTYWPESAQAILVNPLL